MANRNYYIILLIILSFSKLNANNTFHYYKHNNDSITTIDTILITTKYFDEEKIYIIDSICKKMESIESKMPPPIFVRPEGGKSIYLGYKENESYYRIEYDSINTLINNRHYKEKIGSDTLGDIIREIYNLKGGGYGGYFRVKYSNYKTKEVLMLVITEYYTINYTITYFSNNKVIKIDNYSTFKPLAQDSTPVSHISSYYENQNLIGAKIMNNNNCKVKFIYDIDKYCNITFDDCMDVMFENKISKSRFSNKRIKEEEEKLWVKVK